MKCLVVLITLCSYFYFGESTTDCACDFNSVVTLPLTKVGEKYYYVETNTKANWFRASNFCSLHKMRLASISSEGENEDLKHYLKSIQFGDRLGLWTSGNNFADKNVWYWGSLGTRMTYFNWAPGEPNNWAGIENCVECYTTVDNKLIWNNAGCDYIRYFICEPWG